MTRGAMRRLGSVAAAFVVGAVPGAAQEGRSPHLVERWSDVFGGSKATFHVVAQEEKLAWSFSVGGAVVVRRDAARDPRAGALAIEFDVPEVKPGVVLDGVLRLESARGAVSHPIWIFPKDPWSATRQSLKRIDLRLFDPGGETAKAFDGLSLPCTTLRNSALIAGMTNGLIVVAEGLSFLENRGLAAALEQAAAAGAVVICLAPREGFVAVPGIGQDAAATLPGLALRHGEVIADFDKRLDALDWADAPAVLSSWHPTAERRRVEGEWRADASGWPWLAAKFKGGGSLIYCGFGMIRSWERSPAARYLFAALLQQAALDRPEGRAPE